MGGTVSTPQTDKFPLDTTETNDSPLRPSKLLLNVSIENTLGAIQVLMSPENTVGELVKVALTTYDKEKRRPLLNDTDPNRYQLHYSPFTLESNYFNLNPSIFPFHIIISLFFYVIF